MSSPAFSALAPGRDILHQPGQAALEKTVGVNRDTEAVGAGRDLARAAGVLPDHIVVTGDDLAQRVMFLPELGEAGEDLLLFVGFAGRFGEGEIEGEAALLGLTEPAFAVFRSGRPPHGADIGDSAAACRLTNRSPGRIFPIRAGY